MAGHSNRDQEYNQDNEDQRQYSCYFDSSQAYPNQIPKSNPVFSSNTQTFGELCIDDPSQVTDVAMPDVISTDYYVAPVASYNAGWQTYGSSSAGTAGNSIFNINTPGAATDGGLSSYVMVSSPSQNRTYSEHSNRTSFHDSDGAVYSIPEDPVDQVPLTSDSACAVDTEAINRDAIDEEAQSSMPHDQEGVLVDLYSPGRSMLSLSIDAVANVV